MIEAMMLLIPRSPIFDMKPSLLFWEAFVSLAVLGYGFGGVRLIGKARVSVGVALCSGIAIWLSLGGWLNLFQLASRPILLVLLTIGFLLFAWEWTRPEVRERFKNGFRSLLPSSKAGCVAGGIIGVFFLLCFVIHLGSFSWNKFDDVQAYMPFAEKASALGGLQPEPFSERRVTSGVGGSIFLNSTMLAGAGLGGIDFLEGGFGLLALLLCIRSATRVFKLSRPLQLVVLYAAGLFTFGRVNITSVNLSAAIFLAVLLVLLEGTEQDDLEAWSACLIGVLLGAAFTLKSSNIPFCALLLGLPMLTNAMRKRSLQPVRMLLIAGLVSIFVLLPWAIKHRLDEGTVLFPSLGRGYHLSAYGFPTISQTAPLVISLLASTLDFLFPAIAGVLSYLLLRRMKQVAIAPVLAFFVGTAMSAVLFSVSIAGEDIDRFMLPMENLCALLFLMLILSVFSERSRTRWVWPAGAFFLLWVASFMNCAVAQYFYRDPGDIAMLAGAKDPQDYLQVYELYLRPADLAASAERVQRAQASMPVGAAFYENIESAYGFDWNRNHVLIADYPGMAALPPGIPLDSTPEAVRQYFLSKGIHYVMFDRNLFHSTNYSEFRNDPQVHIPWRDMLKLQDQPQVHGYALMEYRVSNRMRDMLSGIAAYQPVLYDDGRLVVVSLDDKK